MKIWPIVLICIMIAIISWFMIFAPSPAKAEDANAVYSQEQNFAIFNDEVKAKKFAKENHGFIKHDLVNGQMVYIVYYIETVITKNISFDEVEK